jgi:uncharacterized protein DUF397
MGNAVSRTAESTLSWQRSSFCADGSCVEAAIFGDQIAMRDAKNVEQPFLRFDRSVWLEFVNGVATGDFRSL